MQTNTFKITCHDFQVKISNEKKKMKKREELEFSLDQIVHKQTSKCPVSEQTLKRLATCRKSVPVKLCVSNNQLKLHFTERKKLIKCSQIKKNHHCTTPFFNIALERVTSTLALNKTKNECHIIRCGGNGRLVAGMKMKGRGEEGVVGVGGGGVKARR